MGPFKLCLPQKNWKGKLEKRRHTYMTCLKSMRQTNGKWRHFSLRLLLIFFPPPRYQYELLYRNGEMDWWETEYSFPIKCFHRHQMASNNETEKTREGRRETFCDSGCKRKKRPYITPPCPLVPRRPSTLLSCDSDEKEAAIPFNLASEP